MIWQPAKQTVAMHILYNISISKGKSDNGIWQVNRT